MMDIIKSGDNVLLIWNNNEPSEISNLVKEIQSIQNVSVAMENSNMIAEGETMLTSKY